MIHREVVGNVEEFFSINEGVSVEVIKLNKRYWLKIVEAYAATSSYDDEAVDRLYEDVELAMSKGTARFPIGMRD